MGDSLTGKSIKGQDNLTGLYLTLAALFVALLITSNVIAVKIIEVGGRILPAAIILFPMTYILGDVLTEVYGLRLARRVIWLGFLGNGVAVLGFWIGGLLPAAPFWGNQDSYVAILGYTPRLLAASFAGYLAGELVNSTVLSRMKVATQGRWLWSRTIASTLVGQGVDSAVFITGAFAGTMAGGDLVELLITLWLVKVGYEALATPLTYVVVGYVKRKEGIDVYDRQVSFNPFAFRG
ncbi:MAG: queuosine precursor transporter [Chloroflexi bacterium]|nr:queuosine precursor transporter [Chloroflexota bacterium]